MSRESSIKNSRYHCMPGVNYIFFHNNLQRRPVRNYHKIEWYFFSHYCREYYMHLQLFVSFLPSQACLQNPVEADDLSDLPISKNRIFVNFFFHKTQRALPVQKAESLPEQINSQETQ